MAAVTEKYDFIASDFQGEYDSNDCALGRLGVRCLGMVNPVVGGHFLSDFKTLSRYSVAGIEVNGNPKEIHHFRLADFKSIKDKFATDSSTKASILLKNMI